MNAETDVNKPASAYTPQQIRWGFFYGLFAYLVWGTFPIYFGLVGSTDPIEVVVWRVAFTFVVCLLALAVTKKFGEVIKVLRSPAKLGWFALAGVMIYLNWEIYIIGVTTHRVLEASLGYFINPVITVLMGVLIWREKLTVLQWSAILVTATGVTISAILYGEIPFIAIGLAFSFGMYGVVKKAASTSKHSSVVSPIGALSLETLCVLPLALFQGLNVAHTSGLTGHTQGAGVITVLVLSGLITAIPLMMFGAATARLPLSYIGFIQFTTPGLQFFYGWLVLNEPMTLQRFIAFGAVWIAIAFLLTDMTRQIRRSRKTATRSA